MSGFAKRLAQIDWVMTRKDGAGQESAAPGPDLLLLREAMAQLDNPDRLPPPEVVLHVMNTHGLNWLQAMAEIKSFAEGPSGEDRGAGGRWPAGESLPLPAP